jgi:putative transposase
VLWFGRFKMAAQQRKRPRQLELTLPVRTWGGARRGAGRKPKGARALMPHTARPTHVSRHPVHVTLRVERVLPSLRTKGRFKVLRRAIRAGAVRPGFRLLHYSVQKDHLHLVVEAQDKAVLGRSLQALQVRMARAVNKLLGRKGRVFADRYHARALRTPREVRNALAYVLLNARKHAHEHGRLLPEGWLDVFSSALSFDGWRGRRPEEPPLSRAQTWLLDTGWRVHGLLEVSAVPGRVT